ncbi:MAG TPA: hypothetical protein VL651_14705 [Bacteroidia bacterium]|jgi:hypothetical protein|nr:hypothetical protein [Bacteroidia bacterium]
MTFRSVSLGSRVTLLLTLFFIISFQQISAKNAPCDSVTIVKLSGMPGTYSPDSSLYFINRQDKKGVYQIYIGKRGDSTTQCISLDGPAGKKRSWKKRNKMQVQWHPSGKFLICAVEWDDYPELHYTPYKTRLGILQCGVWMDIYAVTPDGKNWYQLVKTERGFTGPAFTKDGSKCAWAEGQDTAASLKKDKFGIWRLKIGEFSVNGETPSISNIKDITPANTNWVEPGNFSPDGGSLLLTADQGMNDARGQDQFILNVNTGEMKDLNNTPNVWDEHGMFSADGSKIVWMSSYPYRSDPNSNHIIGIKTEFMIMNADGTDQQQLTHFCEKGYPEYGSGIAAVGSWLPDGRSIFCTTLLFPYYGCFLIRFNGPCGGVN